MIREIRVPVDAVIREDPRPVDAVIREIRVPWSP
jgi:hypothetical protein